MAIFTLGHSTLTEREFVTAARGIDIIVDVRSHPGSRHVPQFNKEEIERWLPEYGIAYEWWPGLGGWAERHLGEWQEPMAQRDVDVAAYARGIFPRQRIGVQRPSDTPNPTEGRGKAPERPSWTNQGLWDYSWFTTTPEFLSNVDQLVQRFGTSGGVPKIAMVCAEACWWKCHRSMIADHLTFRNIPCFHLPVQPPKRPTTRRFKPHAEALGNRLERYHPDVLAAWVRWQAGVKAAA